MESQTITNKERTEDLSTSSSKRIQVNSSGKISSETVFTFISKKYQFVYPSTNPIQTLININKAYHLAIEMGDLKLIKLLFELGVKLNPDDKQNPTPLFIIACKIQNIDCIDKFIRTCQRNANKDSPIIIAIRNEDAVDKDCIFINLTNTLLSKLYRIQNNYNELTTSEPKEAADSPLIYAIKAKKILLVSAILKGEADTSRDLPYHTLIDLVAEEERLPDEEVIIFPKLNKFIKLLKEYHYDIHKLDKKGNDPLMSYCEQFLLLKKIFIINKKSFEKVFDILVSHGCDPTQKNDKSTCPIELIVKNQLLSDEKIFQIFEKLPPEKILFFQDLIYDIHDKKLIEFLLNHGINISFNSKDHEGKTALLKAFDKTNIYLATVILNKRTLNFNDLPFHFLIKKYLKGDFSKRINHYPEDTLIQLMKLLIRHGGNINQPNITGNSPLMTFCEGCIPAGNQTEIEYIISRFWKYDADLTQKNRFGETPIEKIAEYQLLDDNEIRGYLDEFTSEQILESSALLSHTTDIDIIKLFVKNGVSVDTYSHKGTTLLYRAVEVLNLDLVRELIALGAKPTLPRLHEKSLSEYEALAQSKAQAKAENYITKRFIVLTPLELIQNKLETLGLEEGINEFLLNKLGIAIIQLETEILTIMDTVGDQKNMSHIDKIEENRKLDPKEAKLKLDAKKSALATKLEACKKILYILEGKENGDMVSTQPMELRGTQEH
jgi:ankyrin repeat protein